ncbi:hypothetical protein NEOLEDRAFT_1145545 [Neolentinus lepideus HHB14362 ss-1]|uniref:Uncharacterized protein n=1 Tax=Neolentinus lepideus HHB14362 ss-1 TaxID=1314782 RepID=A0A165UV13_9AGAM|nr:hypothetical protein NEOLEDRAFT_1145545 [Neolentinus lepideus HHB14362 ss-1]
MTAWPLADLMPSTAFRSNTLVMHVKKLCKDPSPSLLGVTLDVLQSAEGRKSTLDVPHPMLLGVSKRAGSALLWRQARIAPPSDMNMYKLYERRFYRKDEALKFAETMKSIDANNGEAYIDALAKVDAAEKVGDIHVFDIRSTMRGLAHKREGKVGKDTARAWNSIKDDLIQFLQEKYIHCSAKEKDVWRYA